MTDNLSTEDETLVRVQAQVMTRDDSSGGWVPMGGGGLSNVGLVRRLKPATEDTSRRNEYLIYGQRIADNSMVLKCDVRKDIRYSRPNPKFHHWHLGDKRFGLTFERLADAREFDRGVKNAVADLTDGNDGCNAKLDDEEIFRELDLPISRTGSSSASTNSTTTSSPQSPTTYVTGVPDTIYNNTHNNHFTHLHRVHYYPSPNGKHRRTSPISYKSNSDSIESHDDVWVKADDPMSLSGKSDQGLLDSVSDNVELKEYSYVIFAKNNPHDYSYPNLDTLHKPDKMPTNREAISSVKKHTQITSQPKPPLPVKQKKKDKHKNQQTNRLLQNSRCKHCRDNFSEENNYRGSCEEAPDNVDKCIEVVTCVWCTRALIYHCMSDADGEFGHPCVCDTSDESNCKKWTALSILSLFVPCLWCYWPLKACHMCGVSCGCCGGRHKAS